MKLDRDKILSLLGLASTLLVSLTPVAPEGWPRELAIALSGFCTGLGVHLRKKG